MWPIRQLNRIHCLVMAIVIVTLLVPALSLAVTDEAEYWRLLRSGEHAVLIRHALAPGFGDPSEFLLGDCATQRNLSDEGRLQAARIGSLFRTHGIAAARVFSSQWCRCQETAQLLGLGPVSDLPVLNSFFADDSQREPQTRMLREWLAEQDLSQPLVLVTHQVNITSLTGVYPGSGEIVVIERQKSGELVVIGTMTTLK